MNNTSPIPIGFKQGSQQGSQPSTIQKTSLSGDTNIIVSFQLQAEAIHNTSDEKIESAEKVDSVETPFYQDKLSVPPEGEHKTGFHHSGILQQQSNELARKTLHEQSGQLVSSRHVQDSNVTSKMSRASTTSVHHPQILNVMESSTNINIESKPLVANLQTAQTFSTSQAGDGLSNSLPTHSATNVNKAQISSEWASVKVDPQASKWGQQMLQILHDRVSFQAQQNLQEAKIRLDPPELGKLDLIVRVEGDRLNVQLNASSMATREALNQVSERLRAELQDQNFVHVDVNVGTERDQQSHSDQPSNEDSLHIHAAHPKLSEHSDQSQSDHWLNTHA